MRSILVGFKYAAIAYAIFFCLFLGISMGAALFFPAPFAAFAFFIGMISDEALYGGSSSKPRTHYDYRRYESESDRLAREEYMSKMREAREERERENW